MNIKIIKYLLFLTVFIAGCNKKPSCDPPLSLEGTKWKLAGIVWAETGALKELETNDSRSYTFNFGEVNNMNNNSTLRGNGLLQFVESGYYIRAIGTTYSNTFGYLYHIDHNTGDFLFVLLGGAPGDVEEDHPHGYLYSHYLVLVCSFSLEECELKLYLFNKTEYLLFKQLKP